MKSKFTALVLASLASASLGTSALAQSPTQLSSDLAAPIRVMSGDQPINVDIGHAAPTVADMDGDGLQDLLVGQFGDGALRVYKNVGTKGKPKFDGFEYFEAGGTKAKIPAG